MTQANRFTNLALTMEGKPYVFGAEVKLENEDPAAFDCSELVQWAAYRCGVIICDGSAAQRAACEAKGTLINVLQAKKVRGALLFRPGHVAISLGNGQTIEARGAEFGVCIADSADRFEIGALVPGMEY